MKDILIYEYSDKFSFEQNIEDDKRIGIIRGKLPWFNVTPFYRGESKKEILNKCGLVHICKDGEFPWKNVFVPYLISIGEGYFIKKWGRIRVKKSLYSPLRKTWIRIKGIAFGKISMENIGVFQILKLDFFEKLFFKKGEVLLGEELDLTHYFDVETDAPSGEYRFYSNGFSTNATLETVRKGKILKLTNPFIIFRGEKFILKKNSDFWCGQVLRIRRDQKEKPISLADDEETLLYFLKNPSRTPEITAQTGWREHYIEELVLKLQKEDLIRIISFSPIFAVSKDGLDGIIKKMEDKLRPFHRAKPELMGMEKEKLREKIKVGRDIFNAALSRGISMGKLKLRGNTVSLKDFVPENERKIQEMEEIIEGMIRSEIIDLGKMLKDLKSRRMAEQIISKLIQEGKIYFTGGFLVHSDFVEELKKRIKGKKTLTVQEFKKMTSLSRKYAIPLLELLDSLGITKRENSHRKVLI